MRVEESALFVQQALRNRQLSDLASPRMLP